MLRFRQEDGSSYPELQEHKLGELLSFKNGLNVPKEKFGTGIKYISVLDILNNPFITYDVIKGLVDIDEKMLQTFSVEYGDILFQRSSETKIDAGRSNVYIDKKKIATFGGFVIRGKKIGEYNPEYMNYLLKSSKVRKQIICRAQGDQHVNVGQELLSEICVNLHCEEEQRKIAGLFSSLIEVISSITEELRLWEEKKTGIMQKIFSQEVRFKDENGNDFPEWKEKTIGECCNIFAGGTPSTKVPDYWGGSINWLTSGAIQNNVITHSAIEKKITQLGLEKSSAKLIKPNSVLLAMTGATCGNIGYLTFQTSANQSVMAIEPYVDNARFLFYRMIAARSYILKFQAGGAQAGVNKSSCEELSFEFPCLEEQQKIADCLTTIDEVIELKKKKLETWKNIKKGLLQQMFV